MYCIYLATDRITNKRYIGKLKSNETIPFEDDAFEIEYLETGIETKSEADWYEDWYKDMLQPEVRYRNTIAEQELSLKRSHITKMKWMDSNFRNKLVAAHSHPTNRKGKKLEDFVADPETARKRMSEAKKGYTPWNKGKICPHVTKAKKGKHLSEETKRKMSESHKGKNSTCNLAYKEYKENGGPLSWNEFQKEMKNEQNK